MDSRVRLQAGRVDVRAAGGGSRFQITTPAGVSSARRTEFRIGMAEPEGVMHTEVVDGVVAVEAQDRSRLITAGLGALTPIGQPAEPLVALLPPPDIRAVPTYLDHVPIAFSIQPLPGAGGRLSPPDRAGRQLRRAAVLCRRAHPRFSWASAPDSNYTWRVRGIDGRGLKGLDASKNLALNARPAAPGQLSPEDGTTSPDRRPTFHWQPQLDVIRACGCDEFQGFLFSEAGPAMDVGTMARTGKASGATGRRAG